MNTNPWWLRDGDTKRARKFANYDLAKAAGLRAYRRLEARGFNAMDKFSLQSGGETIGVYSLIVTENEKKNS